MGQVQNRVLKAAKSCSQRALTIHLFRHFCHTMYRLATMQSITDRQLDKQTTVKVKVKLVQLFMEHHLTATEYHLPYGITQCHLPPYTSEHTPPSPQPARPVLDLPTPEGWKAELTQVTCYIQRWFNRPQTVTHPSTNRAQCRLTSINFVDQANAANQYTTPPPISSS